MRSSPSAFRSAAFSRAISARASPPRGKKNPEGDDIYGGRIARSVAGMERDEQNGMDPEKAGAFIAHVATRKGIRPVNTIGLQYKFFCFLVKILPAKTLNWLVGLIYAK